jgi:polyisoprenoid-binding protein YceI
MTDSSRTPSHDVPPGRYRLDPDRSRVHYSGKHRFGTGTVRATFAVREGDLSVGLADEPFGASITIDASSFASDSARRDKDVRGAGLLDVEHYPDITFASDTIQETDDGWLVPGTVTAHGHTAPVDLWIDRVTVSGQDLVIHGSAAHLDRTALGVTKGRGMVGRYLDLEIDAVATPRNGIPRQA